MNIVRYMFLRRNYVNADEKKINRRKLLKSTAIAGAGIGALGALTGDVEANAGREFVTIDGAARSELIKEIQSDPQFENMVAQLETDDRQVEYEAGKFTKIIPESGAAYEFAVLPLSDIDKGSSKEQATINWDSRSGQSPTGFTLETGDNQKPTAEQIESQDIAVEPNNVAPIDSGGGGSGCTSFTSDYCSNFDLTCIAWIIGAIGLSCGTLNPVLCLAGSSVVIGEYTTGDGCNPCDDYDKQNVTYC